MGGRGSSSSGATAWKRQTVYEQAVAIATDLYDKTHPKGSASVASSIPDWVLDKKLSQGERYAFSVGDGAFIKRETEKAYLIANNSDFGQVSFWMPKSWMSSPEKVRSDIIRSEANLHVGANYNTYLKQVASDAGVKAGNLKTTKALKKKLATKGVTFMEKDEFRNSKGHKVVSSYLLF